MKLSGLLPTLFPQPFSAGLNLTAPSVTLRGESKAPAVWILGAFDMVLIFYLNYNYVLHISHIRL